MLRLEPMLDGTPNVRNNRNNPMERFKDKVVIVTSAARDIGRAWAVALASDGADIFILDVTKQFGSINYLPATPQDLAETDRMIKELGRRSVAVQANQCKPGWSRSRQCVTTTPCLLPSLS